MPNDVEAPPSEYRIGSLLRAIPNLDFLDPNRRFIHAGDEPMSSLIEIRQAVPADTEIVSRILVEVAQWQEQAGAPLWLDGELGPEKIGAEISSGLFFVAEYANDPAGTVKFQLEDQLFWPDAPNPDAAYVHRLAVRRRYAGKGISMALLAWAVDQTQRLGRRFLRLDCDADRPKLRAIYESFGFQHHSYRHVGSYFVARYELDVHACGVQ